MVNAPLAAPPGLTLPFEPIDVSRLSLQDFRRRAQRWSNDFDRQYRTLLYVLTDIVDLQTGYARVSRERLQERMREAFERQGKSIDAPSTRTIQRRIATLVDCGVLHRHQPRTPKEWSLKPEFKSNRYWFDFAHVVQSGQVVEHDFFAPLRKDVSHGKSDGVSSGESDGVSDPLAAVTSALPSETPSYLSVSHLETVTDASMQATSTGGSPRTPEAREQQWFEAFATDLAELLNRPVGLDGVRKACRGMTHLDYPQRVRPALQAWVADKLPYILPAERGPIAYVLGTFPTVFRAEWEEADGLFQDVVGKGQALGLLRILGESYPDVMLLDVEGSVVDEWAWDEFEHLADDPANLYALQAYFDSADLDQLAQCPDGWLVIPDGFADEPNSE